MGEQRREIQGHDKIEVEREELNEHGHGIEVDSPDKQKGVAPRAGTQEGIEAAEPADHGTDGTFDPALKAADRGAGLSDKIITGLYEPGPQDRDQKSEREDAEQENGKTVQAPGCCGEVIEEGLPVEDQRPHSGELPLEILHGEGNEVREIEGRESGDGDRHFPRGKEVDRIIAEAVPKIPERLTGTQDRIAVAEGGQDAGGKQEDGTDPVPVIDRPETAEQVSHRHTSRLPEAENEVADNKNDEQDEHDFPDIFQYFHMFGSFSVSFQLIFLCFFVFSIDFFGSL